MTYTIDVQEGAPVLHLHGVIDAGPAMRQLAEDLQSHVAAGHTRWVFDCHRVTQLTAVGLGHLAGLVAVARNRGGEAVLARPPDFVHSLLMITGFHGAVLAYDSVEDAVAALPGETLEDGS